MSARYYFFSIAWMVSVNVFCAAVCDGKIKVDPKTFDSDEFKSRLEWQDAYYSFLDHSKKAPRSFSKAVKNSSKRIANSRKRAVVAAYCQGLICQSADHWMKPRRFFEIIEQCRQLDSALKQQKSMQTTVEEYTRSYARYLNTTESEYDGYLKRQAEAQKNGIAQGTMFSIKNFADETRMIAELFMRKRHELIQSQSENQNLRDTFLARINQLGVLQGRLTKFLKNNNLVISERNDPEVELLFGLEFNGDLASVLQLNRLARDMQAKRAQDSQDLHYVPGNLEYAIELFSDYNAQVYAQEKMDLYAAALDAMVLDMRRYWQDRLKDGYGASVEELVQLTEPHLQFSYVQEKLDVGSDGDTECPFCCDEQVLVAVCENSEHRMCAGCLRNHFLAQLEEGSGNVSCPFLKCGSKVLELDYELLMEHGVFPYEFFEAYKKRVLRRFGPLEKRSRCHMGCFFFHEIPHDKVPGQASPPCEDCKTQTCLSCLNLAHAQGSRECKAPDAESMKKAHDEMLKNGYRRCPGCGVWGIKVSGCDFIRCLCGAAFSNTTGQAWDQKHATRFGYHEFEANAHPRVNNDL